MNFEEEYKKLKRLMDVFNEDKLKIAEEILEIVEDDTSFVELRIISEKMNIKNVGVGKIMKSFSEKYKGKIKKGYIKHDKMKRRIGFFGVKLKNEKMNTQIRIDSAPQMNSKTQEMNSYPSKPIELVSKPVEVKPKPIELVSKPVEVKPKPIEQPSKTANVKLTTHIPEEKLQRLSNCTSYDGFLGTFPKGFSVTASKKKELLAVDSYLIRNTNGTMSVLEDPPPYIKEVWEKAKRGEI